MNITKRDEKITNVKEKVKTTEENFSMENERPR